MEWGIKSQSVHLPNSHDEPQNKIKVISLLDKKTTKFSAGFLVTYNTCDQPT